VRLDTCISLSFYHVSGGSKKLVRVLCDGLSDLGSGVSCELMIVKLSECSDVRDVWCVRL